MLIYLAGKIYIPKYTCVTVPPQLGLVLPDKVQPLGLCFYIGVHNILLEQLASLDDGIEISSVRYSVAVEL